MEISVTDAAILAGLGYLVVFTANLLIGLWLMHKHKHRKEARASE